MANNNNRKLLFNNLDEYQDEVERLEEIIKNQSILIQQLSKKEPKLRESKLIPIIGATSHIHKTFPRFNSPEYLHYMKNNPVFHDIDINEGDFEKRIGDLGLAKSIGKTFTNLHINLESILGNKEKTTEKPIKELLLMQSKGQTLTKEEKERCIKHAESVRLKKRKK
jgi:hypothetical protein